MAKKTKAKTEEITPEEFVDNLELDFNDVVEEEKVEIKSNDDVIKYGSEGWSDYVLSLFTEKEMLDGKYPRCAALRRVGLMLGDIVSSGPSQVFAGTDGGVSPRTTVVYEIEINWKWNLPVVVSQGQILDGFHDNRRFSAVADCDHDNAEYEFAKHSAAMAETRAEARCWRKILLLDRVSAEEMQSPDNEEEIKKKYSGSDNVTDDRSKATKIQMNTITVMCDRVGVDLEKRIKQPISKDGEDKTFEKLEDLDRGYASALLSELNKYQSGEEVPAAFSVR